MATLSLKAIAVGLAALGGGIGIGVLVCFLVCFFVFFV